MNTTRDANADEPPVPHVVWDIQRTGRAWGPHEAMARYALTPEKFEMCDGKLFRSHAASARGLRAGPSHHRLVAASPGVASQESG